MATKTDIANIAIGAHSGAWVSNIDAAHGRTPDAINAQWANALEEALAEHLWKFAKWSWNNVAPDATVVCPDPDFPFAYRQPADCLRVFEIRPQIDFDEWGNNSGRFITCAEGQSIMMIGTVRGVDIGRFTATFANYLGLLLAYKICTPINASEAIRKRCKDDMAEALAKAKADSGKVGRVKRPVPDSFMRERISGARGSWLK